MSDVEILSREEFEAYRADPVNVYVPNETKANTIAALEKALLLGLDEYWASTDSDDYKDDDERELTNMLRDKGWFNA